MAGNFHAGEYAVRSYAEVGCQLSMSAQHVREVELKALRKVRQKLIESEALARIRRPSSLPLPMTGEPREET